MLKLAVIIFVFVGAMFVFISQTPEQVFARSQDGVVTLRGASSHIRSVEIDSTRHNGMLLTSGVSEHYLIVPDVSDLEFSSSIEINILEQWKQVVSDQTTLRIYQYAEGQNDWMALKTDVSLGRNLLSAQLNLSGPVWIAVGSK